MRYTKYVFWGYMVLTFLVLLGIGASFWLTPGRDQTTYYVPYGEDIKSLDPAEIDDVESDSIAANIFECLYTYRYGVLPYTLIPAAAEGEPSVSPDGLTMTVHVKKGIHFYDPEKKVFPDSIGPEITAKDFVYAWKRVCNFHLATNQYTGVFQGHVVGLDDWYDYTEKTPEEKINWDKPVEGLQAPDDSTIVIKFTRPYPQMRYLLAHTPTAVVSRKAYEFWGADKFKEHPIGTGPYMLQEQLKEQHVVLVANPIYRGGPDVESDKPPPPEQRLPHIARVQMDYFVEDLPIWLLFRQGLFDVSGIPKDTFKQAIASSGELTPQMQKDGMNLAKLQEPDTWYVAFNMKDPVVGKNKPLRQAMSMAFDREKYIQIYLNGRGTPAIGPIPPGFPTFDEKQVNPYTKFDLPAARQKLKEAEQINGGPISELTLSIGGTDTAQRQMAEYFVSQMEAIGLHVKTEYWSWARLQQMIDSRQVQMFFFGWDADYPDEQTFLQLLYGKNGGKNGINSTDYQNPEYDALYEKAMVLEPGPERDGIYRQMEQIVMEDSPWLLINYSVRFTLFHDWLQNVKPMSYTYATLMYRSLDFDKRTAWLRTHQ